MKMRLEADLSGGRVQKRTKRLGEVKKLVQKM